MIRTRGGDFCYNNEEFQQMKNQLLEFKKVGADGFVFGILDGNLEVNFIQNKELVELAEGIPCTFHRAFDRVKDYHKSLEEIIKCGFKTILTSGTKSNVSEGKEILKT
jgi:copper homeostasis protein